MFSIQTLRPRYLFLSLALFASHGLASPADAQNRTALARHMPEMVSSGQAQVLGALDGTQRLQLALSLPLRNERALDALLVDLYDPSSPSFHQYLEPAVFAERFSPRQADYDAVVAWARDKGLTVTATTPNRRVVDVEGTVDVISHAFHVKLQQYRDPERTGRTFHAPDREPTMDLAVPLLAISGLDTAQPKVTHLKKFAPSEVISNGAAEPAAIVPRITGSGPGSTYLPSDMRAAYYGSGPLTGSGQTVAIFSFDGYKTSDVSLYYSITGMASSVPINNVLVNGYNGACFGFNSDGSINRNTCDDGEQVLDIVNVIGMAPGITQLLFYEGNSATDVLNRMVTDNLAKVISCSWGGGDFGSASTPIFKQMAAQGQTFLNASGDSGQFNSSTYYPPALEPNITQVGGTGLVTIGAAGPWASETGWSYSGGGYRTTAQGGFTIPSWQQMAGVINASNQGSPSYRNAPDVAAEADFDNTTVSNGSFGSGYGGTSFAAPRWAGFIALANQQSAANGKGPLGFLNPTLYNIGVGAAYTANFHDVTSGKNKPSAGAGAGFNAVTGYDLITGWGSPTSTLINTLAPGSWTKVAREGDTVFLPKGTTYRYGIDTRYLSAVTTTADQTFVVSNATLGGDPAQGVVKELDVIGNGSGVLVNGVPFGSPASWTRVASEGDTVFLPRGTTYRYGIDSRYLAAVTTTADQTIVITNANLGGDPAQGVVKELDVIGSGAGVLVNGVPFSPSLSWTRVAMEGDTVFLPRGTTYRFGIDTRFLSPVTTTADWTVLVYWTNFGADPAQGVVKELDVTGNGAGVVVNGVPFR